MRLINILPLLLIGPAAASIFDSSSSQVVLSDDKKKVPGDNPLEFCDDPKDYILEIEKVDLDPNPPKP